MRGDLHQHIWTESLLDALEARRNHPFVRREGGLAVVHCAAEHPYVIEVASESPDRRAALLHADGLDLALIAISSPIGIEALPHDEAHNLIGAHLDGVAELGEEFSAWGPIAVDEPDPDDVDAVLDRGCLGVSLPAACLAGVEHVSAIGYVLERIAARGVPLLIHPGPGPGQARHEAPSTEARWWRAMTDYVAQMHAAWLTFAAFGRREHPTLRIVFAMLAGGAPLISERLQARGGPGVDIRDPLSYYETSSYGPRAVDAMARWVGDGQLVYGSDRPVIEPTRTGREKLLQANAAQLVQMRVRDAGARGVEVHA